MFIFIFVILLMGEREKVNLAACFKYLYDINFKNVSKMKNFSC
jgi:hypothetical protein